MFSNKRTAFISSAFGRQLAKRCFKHVKLNLQPFYRKHLEFNPATADCGFAGQTIIIIEEMVQTP